MGNVDRALDHVLAVVDDGGEPHERDGVGRRVHTDEHVELTVRHVVKRLAVLEVEEVVDPLGRKVPAHVLGDGPAKLLLEVGRVLLGHQILGLVKPRDGFPRRNVVHFVVAFDIRLLACLALDVVVDEVEHVVAARVCLDDIVGELCEEGARVCRRGGHGEHARTDLDERECELEPKVARDKPHLVEETGVGRVATARVCGLGAGLDNVDGGRVDRGPNGEPDVVVGFVRRDLDPDLGCVRGDSTVCPPLG